MYENLANGVVPVIPSAKFYQEILEQNYYPDVSNKKLKKLKYESHLINCNVNQHPPVNRIYVQRISSSGDYLLLNFVLNFSV